MSQNHPAKSLVLSFKHTVSLEKVFILVFNLNVSSTHRKYLRNIKNEHVLVMWNELEIKDRRFLMMCFLQSKSDIQNTHVSLPILTLNAKTMKFSVNLPWSCGCIDMKQVRELLVINNLPWWLDSCNINSEKNHPAYLVSQKRKFKNTYTHTNPICETLGSFKKFFSPQVCSLILYIWKGW